MSDEYLEKRLDKMDERLGHMESNVTSNAITTAEINITLKEITSYIKTERNNAKSIAEMQTDLKWIKRIGWSVIGLITIPSMLYVAYKLVDMFFNVITGG